MDEEVQGASFGPGSRPTDHTPAGHGAPRFDPSRGFLPKPAYGAACNSCGQCCAAVQCIVSVALFGEHDLCPALEDGGNQRLVCGVIRDPVRYASTPKWSADVLGEALAIVIGAGIGCDSLDAKEPARAVAVGRRAIYGRSAAALERASPEARRLVELLRDRDGAEGGDADAAPVPQDRQARAEGIAHG